MLGNNLIVDAKENISFAIRLHQMMIIMFIFICIFVNRRNNNWLFMIFVNINVSRNNIFCIILYLEKRKYCLQFQSLNFTFSLIITTRIDNDVHENILSVLQKEKQK